MRSAIPFYITLSPRETEKSHIPAEELLGRLTCAFSNCEIDRERGRREVLQRMQQMLSMGAPEVLVQHFPRVAQQAAYVAVRWPDWPANLVSGQIKGLERELEGLYFYCESHDFAFLKFASGQLATALNMRLLLMTPDHEAIDMESWPGPLDAHEWIQARYAERARYAGEYDPDKKTWKFDPGRIPVPVLQELNDWPEKLHRGLCRYLSTYPHSPEAMTQGFASFDDCATAYVRELAEFSPVRQCWSVKPEQSHHNEVLVDHAEWMTRIDLGGVPAGLFDQ